MTCASLQFRSTRFGERWNTKGRNAAFKVEMQRLRSLRKGSQLALTQFKRGKSQNFRGKQFHRGTWMTKIIGLSVHRLRKRQ